MKVEKQGRIFENRPSFGWSHQYAGIPTAYLLNEEVIRIYYYSMDADFNGRISFIDVSARNPANILQENPNVCLDIGAPGAFDDSGVCPSCFIELDNQKHLIYLGVQRLEKVPYLYFAGSAKINPDGSLTRNTETPLLERSEKELFVRSATTVLKTDAGYRMWYVSGDSWISVEGKKYPSYEIRTILSKDGISWPVYGQTAVSGANEKEFGFGRPWVVFHGDLYKMFYSIRSLAEPYKIGYAESSDGVNWTRMDEKLKLPRSAEGWDSAMICYPCVIETKYGWYLFHNGNQHGKSGFGYAKILEW